MSVHAGGRGPGHLARSGAAFYPDATVALDFLLQDYRVGSGGWYVRDPSLLTGWSFSRASPKTALTSSGAVVSFGSGVPAITDLGFLVEGASTNISLQSQNFATPPWGASSAGAGVAPITTANFATAPDGTNTATRAQFSLAGSTTSADLSSLRQSLTLTSGVSYASSVWVKSNTGSTYNMQLIDESGSTKIPVTVTPSWQRLSVVHTSTTTAGSWGLWLRGAQTPTNSDTADVLIWGGQVEQASAVSSYIPTTSASVTRAADVASISGLVLPTTGTAFAKAIGTANTANPRLFGSNSATADALLYQSANSAGTYNGATVLSQGGSISAGSAYKAATTWTPSGRSVTSNGLNPLSDSNSIGTLGTLYIGSDKGTASFYGNFIQQMVLTPAALDIKALTQ